MHRSLVAMALLSLLMGSGLFAEDKKAPKAAAPVMLSALVNDGSLIVGKPGLETLSVKTSYTEMKLALDVFARIRRHEDGPFHVTMGNGDTVIGDLTPREIPIKTSIGFIKVPTERLVHLDIAAVRLDQGLAAHYPMNGDAKDVSGNKCHGKVTGAQLAADRLEREGHAYAFSGKSDVITIPNSPHLQITGDMTICMWLYAERLDKRQNPFNKAYGAEGTWTLEPGGTVNFYYGRGGGDRAPYTSLNMARPVKLKTWTHLMLVRDLTRKKVTWYKDGVQIATAKAAYSATKASSLPLRLGVGYTASKSNGSPFKGRMDDVRIYNRALNDLEARALFHHKESP
jgi:hypothetical protein